ncbi:MAG: hypothetical protein LBB88_10680 [Planctomycetaceae bacterium]|nr:hypothetical protein [Planctomycetaceae bacterium]
MGGHWRQRGLRGHWGHTNLKTMINDSTENNSFLKREIFLLCVNSYINLNYILIQIKIFSVFSVSSVV